LEGLPIFTVVTMLVDPVWPTVDGAEALAECLLEVWIHALGDARADRGRHPDSRAPAAAPYNAVA
jgi:hypothetical protein